MDTTHSDLTRIYDKTVKLLEARIDDGTATAADVTNLLRLLDKAALLSVLRTRPGENLPDAIPADLPFPLDDAFELAELGRIGRGV